MALPSEEEQAQLLNALAELVAEAGPELLVSSQLVSVNSDFFPGPWVPTAEGLRLVALRLLALAGLKHLDAYVGVGSAMKTTQQTGLPLANLEHGSTHAGAAAWFLGIGNGTCWFGVDEGKLSDPEGALAAMAHEVAHAFREHHQLVDEDRGFEELLTDVTTIFLGFGVLTTNGAYRYRSSGGMVGSNAVTRWSHESQGYLSPDSMAFLLAAQALARGIDNSGLRKIEGQLEANQADAFSSACKKLRSMKSDLRARLGLAQDTAWPPPTSLTELYAKLPAAPPPHLHLVVPEETTTAAPAGEATGTRSTFRARTTGAARWTFWSTAPGLIVATVSARRWDLPASTTFLLLMAFWLVGYWLGKRRYEFFCTEPTCGYTLFSTSPSCPHCKRKVAGELRSRDDRLAAEEVLQKDGTLPRSPWSRPPNKLWRALQIVFSIGMAGLVFALAQDSYEELFANDVRLFLEAGSPDATVSIDGAPPVPIQHGFVRLKLRAGSRSLHVVKDGKPIKFIQLHVEPGVSHALRAEPGVCFATLSGTGYYGPPTGSDGSLHRRIDQDDFALPGSCSFPDELPAQMAYEDIAKLEVVYAVECADFAMKNAELAASVRKWGRW